jgi:hypothetical protein
MWSSKQSPITITTWCKMYRRRPAIQCCKIGHNGCAGTNSERVDDGVDVEQEPLSFTLTSSTDSAKIRTRTCFLFDTPLEGTTFLSHVVAAEKGKLLVDLAFAGMTVMFAQETTDTKSKTILNVTTRFNQPRLPRYSTAELPYLTEVKHKIKQQRQG